MTKDKCAKDENEDKEAEYEKEAKKSKTHQSITNKEKKIKRKIPTITM